ncbi:hypothetical protein [Bacillus sp. AFS031507]|uniref:hypothetical protein n=1 Tax=Bacillus sp. AFS031507 TaxID=2033496 RepID=UPI000BFC2D4E|nr:hypothetical protein [Bacillus sp. AFS031507]PGY15964.1 hypothetical protein COE25_01440 [Bacillus sp. AFS031507]
MNPSNPNNTSRSSEIDLKTILTNQNKEELMRIILDLSDDFPEIEKQLLFKYTPHKDEISSAKKLITESINSAKRKGFIDWRHVGLALQGADLTLQKAQGKVDKGEWESAILLSLVVLSPVVKMLNFSDDSNGSIGDVMNWAIRTIDDAVIASLPNFNEIEKKGLFDAIVKEALKEHYNGWSDWRYALLKICTYYSPIKDLRKKLEKQLKSLYEKTESSWSDRFEKTQIKLLQFEIIERCDGVDAAEKFIYENIKHTEFREKAIANELGKDDYKKVIQLCLDGEKADAEYRGLVQKWRVYRYQASELLGDIEQQKQLARELLFKNEFTYYLKLKELYGSNEWDVTLKKLVDDFKKMEYQPSVYLSILKEENLSDELLNYCQNHISSIKDLYPYVIKEYLEEVNNLFIKYIEYSAEEATDRKKYRSVCSIIKTYKNACGTIHSHKLIGELRQKYMRRPAFLEELGKIR